MRYWLAVLALSSTLVACGAEDSGSLADIVSGPLPWRSDAPADATWLQLSTDDSTSMASAQLWKQAATARGALLAHEFVNYYDPPSELFDAEPWTAHRVVNDTIDLGVETVTTSDGFDLFFQMRARPVGDGRRPWHLVYVIDVSGSMAEAGKMEYAKRSLKLSLEHLRAGDYVTLVTFSDDAKTVFAHREVADGRADILYAFDALEPDASTNMIAGLERGYALAGDYYDPDVLQRVVLYSDGMANVGDTDIEAFESLTRRNDREGIYLTAIGVGASYDRARLDRLSDAGKGASVFLPNADEVDIIAGDYFEKLIEVAADSISIVLHAPPGIQLVGFSGEETSTDPEAPVQDIILAAGDDMTFIARFTVSRAEAMQEPASLDVTLRPLADAEPMTVSIAVDRLDALLGPGGKLLERTRIIDAFGREARDGLPSTIAEALDSYGALDAGLREVRALAASR